MLRFRWSRLNLPFFFSSSSFEIYMISSNSLLSSSWSLEFIWLKVPSSFCSGVNKLAMIASKRSGSSSSSIKSSELILARGFLVYAAGLCVFEYFCGYWYAGELPTRFGEPREKSASLSSLWLSLLESFGQSYLLIWVDCFDPDNTATDFDLLFRLPRRVSSISRWAGFCAMFRLAIASVVSSVFAFTVCYLLLPPPIFLS